MQLVNLYSAYVRKDPLSVVQKWMVASRPTPLSASCRNAKLALSIDLVTVISLIDGADASRLAARPTGDPIPRPTPHWKLFTSTQSVWPFSVTLPLIFPFGPYCR